MKSIAFFLIAFACIHVNSYAQKFTPDAYGYVSDPAFHKLVKDRQYQLVEQFYPRIGKVQGAEVLKNNTSFYIDQDGNEFATLKELENHHRPKIKGEQIMQEGFYSDRAFGGGGSSKSTQIHYGAKDGGKSFYTRYSNVEKLENGYFKVSKSNKYGIYSSKGTEILPVEFSRISEKHGKYVAEDREENYFVYDKSWSLLESFSDFTPFRKTLYIVKKDTASGIYDVQTNEMVLPCKFDDIGHLYMHNDYAEVSINTGIIENTAYGENEVVLTGVIDTNGRLVVEPIYTWLQICERSGYFVVEQNQKYGVVGKKGEILLPLTYEKLYSLDGSSLTGETKLPASMLVFKENGLAGLMTIDKKVLIKPVYDGLMVVYIGMIAVKGNQKGIITPEGKFLVPMQEMEIRNVTGGTVSAEKNGRRCTLDFYGNCYFK